MKKLGIFQKAITFLLHYMGLCKYKLEVLADNPRSEQVKDRVVYVVGDHTFIKWAYLKCPCGCGETIMLRLNSDQFPSWSVRADRLGRINISPSIFRTEGCKSHFWILSGNVKWSGQRRSKLA